jgi:hypothetical protein
LVDVEQNTRCGLLRGAHRLAAVLGPLITTAPALRRFFVAWAPPNKPLSLLRHITARGWMQADSRRKAEGLPSCANHEKKLSQRQRNAESSRCQ